MNEIEELKAHIERLRQAINLMIKHGEQWEYRIDIAEYALSETPAQAVCGIKRAAVDEFVEQFGYELTSNMTFDELYKVAEMYTQTLCS